MRRMCKGLSFLILICSISLLQGIRPEQHDNITTMPASSHARPVLVPTTSVTAMPAHASSEWLVGKLPTAHCGIVTGDIGSPGLPGGPETDEFDAAAARARPRTSCAAEPAAMPPLFLDQVAAHTLVVGTRKTLKPALRHTTSRNTAEVTVRPHDAGVVVFHAPRSLYAVPVVEERGHTHANAHSHAHTHPHTNTPALVQPLDVFAAKRAILAAATASPSTHSTAHAARCAGFDLTQFDRAMQAVGCDHFSADAVSVASVLMAVITLLPFLMFVVHFCTF